MRKQAQTNIKKPNALIYALFYLLIYPIVKLCFRLEVDRSKVQVPEGAFVVVSNHQSFMDFVLVMLAMYPHRLNAVTAQKFFFYPPLNWLLPLMGCIPKNLFESDPRAIKGILSVIKRGGKLLLFPEGRCTVDGGYMGMNKATGKLIKKLGVPVIDCHIEGSYTCMPFWRRGLRFGRERVTLTTLFTAEDTQSLSVDEINHRLDRALSGANTAPSTKPFRVFRARKLAEGLETILYYCPKCEQEFTLVTEHNNIRCTACGNAATMNREAKLIPAPGSVIPESAHAWYREQVSYEMKFLREDEVLIEAEVVVRMAAQAGLAACGSGTLRLDHTGWYFRGRLHDEDAALHFPIETVPALPFDPRDNFQIYANGQFYAFTPTDNLLACAKYATRGECAYWRFAHTVQMTSAAACGFARGREETVSRTENAWN